MKQRETGMSTNDETSVPAVNSWSTSEFAALPAPGGARNPELSDYLQLAHGLAALLAGCSPRGAEREFAASLKAYRALRIQIRRGGEIRLPAQVLNDLSHEIACHADQETREAALRCLRQRQSLRRAQRLA